jgi:hypothetical protein
MNTSTRPCALTRSCATRRQSPGGMEGPTCSLSQQAVEAGGSLTLEVQGRVGAAPTTPEWVGTVRRSRSGKQDGKVYECRNQWWNPLKR